jgi:general secretion pathway protein H
MMPISVCNSPHPARIQRGFTLLELLLVLTIIGMASILVVPNVGNLDSRSFAVQVRQANTLLNHARRMAVVQGQPRSVHFILEERASENPASGAASDNEWRSERIQLRVIDSTDQELEIDERFEVTFYPEGGSSGGSLQFELDGQQAVIHIDPFTGRINRGDDGA